MALRRDVFESARVSVVLDNEIQHYPRVEEVFRALTWRLAREPTSRYTHDLGNGWHVTRTQAWEASGVAVIVVLYKFDRNRVDIEHIIIRPVTQ